MMKGNKIRCKRCGQELESIYGHDYKKCNCPNATFIDGRDEYLRVEGKNLDDIELWDRQKKIGLFNEIFFHFLLLMRLKLFN